MKVPGLLRGKRKGLSEVLVREREGLQEKKLGMASLRENLVHEEFHVNVKQVYDFRQASSSLIHSLTQKHDQILN